MNTLKKVLFSLTAFFALNSTCKWLTDDFSLDHLLKTPPSDSRWATFEQIDSSITSALNQPYTYLGKGKQAFVFVSEDGEHVLKLFKPALPFWSVKLFGKPFKISLSKLPLFPTLCSYLYADKHEEQRENDFQSYVNSFTLLKEETQLEYLHLAKTSHLLKALTIYDKIGVKRHIDLDSTSFLLQKKTDMLYPTLHHMIRNKEGKKAKELLEAFVELSVTFIQKGIIKPTTVEKNFGCIGLKPIQIDVGRVLTAQDLAINDTSSFSEKLDLATHHMKKWLLVRDPFLAQDLDALITFQKQKNGPSSL
jgi:hypothetical protein